MAAGGLATDHGHYSADTTPLTDAAAARIYADALAGTVTTADAQVFAAFAAESRHDQTRLNLSRTAQRTDQFELIFGRGGFVSPP